MLGAALPSDVKAIGVWPPMVDVMAGPPPLNGTCTRSSPNFSLNSSPTSRGCVFAPDDAKLYLPGLARTSATSSFTSLAGTEGCTVSACGPDATSVTGVKSFSVS